MKKIPIPSMINWMWNMGFILSMLTMTQILTGIILSMNFMNENNPFHNNISMMLNNNWGWTMRMIHMNFPSFIFMIMILHFSRNIYFNSFKNKMMWNSGMMLMILMMMTSFMGYTLPWSQMSFWGMMVITNMISIIPMIGKNIMLTLWGSFNINQMTLNRMFILHFMMPMIMMMMMILHVNILHKNLSFNQMGLSNKIDMISFKSYFMIKDISMMMMMLILMINIMMSNPIKLNNPDNFIMMNYMITPNSIEPEWYFMVFYSILRLINNKIGGLTITIMFFLMIYFLPMINMNKFQSNKFYLNNKVIMWIIMIMMLLITKMGFKKMEEPFLKLNKMFILTYFTMFMMMMIINKITDKTI